MILPAKFSKSIGNNKLMIGISIGELVTCSFFPIILNFLGIDPFVSLMSFIFALAVLALKNKLMAPAYLKNAIDRKEHIAWERIVISD